ncbi:glycine betaine ABC transporter substrate-binding protein [Chitinophaga sp. OAE865]
MITGWAPHWMFARYQLCFPEDPERFSGKQKKYKLLPIMNSVYPIP